MPRQQLSSEFGRHLCRFNASCHELCNSQSLAALFRFPHSTSPLLDLVCEPVGAKASLSFPV